MTTDTPTPNADKPLYGDYGGWSEPELNHAMQNGFGEVCKHGQLARSCETCQLERDLAECRASLAERQAAIDEIVACKDATDALSIRHGGEWYTASYANEAKAVTDRKDAIWPALRALATKEPQP